MSIETANTIKKQINGTDRWAFGAWGTTDMYGIPASDENLGALVFKVSNNPKTKGRANVEITLEYNDLYTVRVYKLKNYTKAMKAKVLAGEEVNLEKEVERVEGVYFDQLVDVIDGILG